MEGYKLIAVFVLMMLMLWRRISLGRVMIGGSILLAILYGAKAETFIAMFWQATWNFTTIELIIILGLIMILEPFLGQHGYLDRMLKGLNGLIRDRRVVMAFLPALIGLMPSVGGALFSAPLVGRAAGMEVSAEEKTFINFYYRHIWEYFLPVYPGVLLASRLSGTPLHVLIAALAPYGLLVILLGLPSLRRIPVIRESEVVPGDRKGLVWDFLAGILPVLVIVFLVMFLRVGPGLAVLVVLAGLLVRHRYTPIKLWRLFREVFRPNIILIVWEIMVFKQVLIDTRAVDGILPLLARMPVPEFVVFGLVSFLVGMMTGLVSAYVGIVFPIVMVAGGGQISLPLVVFVFVAGYVGDMLTPMHLCLSLTVKYFKADLRKVLQMLLGPELTLLAIAFTAYLIL